MFVSITMYKVTGVTVVQRPHNSMFG